MCHFVILNVKIIKMGD